MSKASHQVFKRIVLHNKLLSEAEVAALLAEFDDPEHAVQELVRRHVLNDKTAEQFLSVYKKQLDKLFVEELEALETPAARHPPEHRREHIEPKKPEAKEPASKEPRPKEPEHKDREHKEPPHKEPPHKEPPHKEPAHKEPAHKEPAHKEPRHEEPPHKPKVEVQDRPPLPAAGRELIDFLLREAHSLGASDLHLKAGMAPVVRVNGELRELPHEKPTVESLKRSMLAILDGDQRHHFTNTHDLDFCYDGGPELGRFRTNFLMEHHGPNAVFRLIPSKVPSFEELHLPEQVKRFTEQRVGVVLVTGPKGCGKSTTLAAMVDQINSTRAEHIITVEDPIEFVHPCKKGHVNQRQVGAHTQSFSNALRSALREAPDVIMVGEMRDLETTSLAITAAETGHLVLATLHTPDAIRTIGRVLDVFPPKEQPQIRAMLSESLRGIVSQLLLPGADGQSMALAVEILVNTPAIGHLIREEKVHQIRGLMQTGKQYGMVLMEESLVRLAKDGRITKQTAVSWAEDVKFVQHALSSLPD